MRRFVLSTIVFASAFVIAFSAQAQNVCVESAAGDALTGAVVEVFKDFRKAGHFETGDSHCVSVSTATGRESAEVPQDLRVDVYPNPAVGSATVAIHRGGVSGVSLEMVDMLGRRVLASRSSPGLSPTAELRLGGLSPGTYFVRLAGDGMQVTRALVVSARSGGSAGVAWREAPTLPPAARFGALADIQVRVTRLGYTQSSIGLDNTSTDVVISLPAAREMTVHAVDMADHRHPLSGGVLVLEELRTGLTKEVEFRAGPATVVVESDSMRIQYRRADGDTTFTSGRQVVREGEPADYGRLLAASFSEFLGGPITGSPGSVTVFAMDDSFPFYNYIDWQARTIGGSFYTSAFQSPDSHWPNDRHFAIEWDHEDYRAYAPPGSGADVRVVPYYYDMAECPNSPPQSVSDSMQGLIDATLPLLGAVADMTHLTVSFSHQQGERYAERAIRVESGDCFSEDTGAWNIWTRAEGPMYDMMFGVKPPHPGTPGEGGTPAYVVDQHEVLKIASILFGPWDWVSFRWPRVTSRDEPAAITPWAKRWFAVSTAYGPISWGNEYTTSPVSGMWWSIYWGHW